MLKALCSKNMKKLITSILFVFTIYQVNAQTHLTLKECIETAIQNNLEVRQSEIQSKNNEIQYQQARLNRLPNLNASVGHGLNQGRSIDPFSNSYVNSQLGYGNYGVSAGVTLFNGGALSNAVVRDKHYMQAAQYDFQQAKDNLTIDVILAYLTVLSNEDVLTQTRNQAELSHQQVERLVVLNRDGSIPPSQLSDLQGQYAGEELAVINSKNALQASKLNLCRLMNVSYGEKMTLEKINPNLMSLYGADPEIVFQQALTSFAGIKAADFRFRGAEKAVDVARGQLWPSLRFGVNVNTNYSSAAQTSTLLSSSTSESSDFVNFGGSKYPVMRQTIAYSADNIPYTRQLTGNFFSSLGVTLNIPIFNGLEQRNRIKLAKLNVKNNELVANTAQTQLEQAIDLAYINLQTSLERSQTLEQQVQAFKTSFLAAEVGFNEGVGNSIDYLIAKNNLDRAKIQLISAQYDAVLRVRILEFYQGEIRF